MSHFYGTIDGQAGQATRRGSKNSGLRVVAASWDGAVEVTLRHDEAKGYDVAEVSLIPWQGRGVRRHLWRGTVDDQGLFAVSQFVVTLSSDQGPRKVKTAATSFDRAAQIVCEAEGAPICAVLKVERAKERKAR